MLECILPIKESIEEMEKVIKRRFINELKAIIEMLAKFIGPINAKWIFEIKYTEQLCKATDTKNFDIKNTYLKSLEGKCDNIDAKRQVNECLQTLEMCVFLQRLRTTDHTLVDCDWQRNVAMMNFFF